MRNRIFNVTGYGAKTGILKGSINGKGYVKEITSGGNIYECYVVTSKKEMNVAHPDDSGTWYYTVDGKIVGMYILGDIPQRN